MGQPAKKLDTPATNIIGNAVRPFGMRDKIGYMFGDWGNDFFFILAASFLMVFYTDVYHISPALVGTLFLVARLWDAIADVTVGRFIDSRKAGKNGKFRPWIFRMSFPLVIVGVLMFVHIPGMSTGFYEAYAFVTYLLWGTLYSTVNIPYGSMASVMTADPVERTTLSTFRSLGGALAGLIINVVGPLILFVDNKADANRFILGAVIFGVLSLACYMACYTLTVERIVAPNSETPKGNFAQTVKGLGKNKPLIWILVASLLFLVCFMLVGTVNVYLFKDYFSNAKALSMVGLIQTVALIIAMPMVKPLVAKFGKKELASAGLLLSIVVYALLYFLPNVTVGQFTGVLAVGMFGFSFFNLVIWAFVTDVIDYHEYVTGLREDGTVYSIYSFARKVGQAVAGGLGGYAIAAVGYNSASQTQTQEALHGIHSLATLVPALLLLVVFLILVFFYPLNKKRTIQLTADLAERRKV
ncbi:MFS transporter [Neobacillus sp. MM2021_6]|uniref:MFS transporter n=1 Tax=Bacillaceae TaxID=186817 RepID=UPI00140CFDB8|nr:MULTISPECIES: MFS transporter [Bacillaceae]MBO0961619.1 MFS transporter [Neobacillus sp. MM2021_6]NHC19466.1 MFS transporter [Bacillus sp. MM2020_4]